MFFVALAVSGFVMTGAVQADSFHSTEVPRALKAVAAKFNSYGSPRDLLNAQTGSAEKSFLSALLVKFPKIELPRIEVNGPELVAVYRQTRDRIEPVDPEKNVYLINKKRFQQDPKRSFNETVSKLAPLIAVASSVSWFDYFVESAHAESAADIAKAYNALWERLATSGAVDAHGFPRLIVEDYAKSMAPEVVPEVAKAGSIDLALPLFAAFMATLLANGINHEITGHDFLWNIDTYERKLQLQLDMAAALLEVCRMGLHDPSLSKKVSTVIHTGIKSLAIQNLFSDITYIKAFWRVNDMDTQADLEKTYCRSNPKNWNITYVQSSQELNRKLCRSVRDLRSCQVMTIERQKDPSRRTEEIRPSEVDRGSGSGGNGMPTALPGG